jgi:hypothetical protein
VYQPTEKENPQDSSENKLNDGYYPSALQQLSQPWDKKAAQCSKHVSF